MNILISAERIQTRVGELARQITIDYQNRRPLTIVGVLTGSLMFLVDLVRQLDMPLRIGLLQASSYRGAVTTPGTLHLSFEMTPDVCARHVLVLDDILDTGQTLTRVTDHIRGLGCLSLRTAVLLRKLEQQQTVVPDYCGFDIPNVFVVGYGLDFNDEYRHLPYLAVLPETAQG